jgi:VWFA-related protein
MKLCRVVLFTFLLIAPLAFAEVSERVTVTLVEVPVTVVDGNGNPIRGLKAENFVLSDDRGKHDITAFEAIDFASSPKPAIEAAARRNFLLLFDLSNATPNKLARAQRAAGGFVKGQSHPLDHFAVGTIDSEHGFRLVTAFTTDRELVLAAISDPAAFIASDPLGIGRSLVVRAGAGGSVLSTDMKGSPGSGFW